MNDLVFKFEQYTDMGFKVIPLRPKSKVPVWKKWNKRWSRARAYNHLKKNPNSNIALILGEIIDVEGDSPEANETIFSLIGDVPHPSYKSFKSVHHLFLNPDSILTRRCVNEIEFRAHKHHAVLPPSIHKNGIEYTWIDGIETEIPDMPPALLEYYNKIRKQPKEPKRKEIGLKAGHIQPWCAICNERRFIHIKRFKLELSIFNSYNQRWQCQDCRKIDTRKNMIRN